MVPRPSLSAGERERLENDDAGRQPCIDDQFLTRDLVLPIRARRQEAAHTAVEGDWFTRCQAEGGFLLA